MPVFAQAFQANLLHVRRHMGFVTRRPHRLAEAHAQERLHWRAAGKRRLPRQHLVQHRSERIDVGCRAESVVRAFGLFGRHVVGRADDLAGLRMRIALLVQQGQPEVGDLGFAAVIQEDVAGFDVAMNDAALVGEVHGPGQAASDLGRPNCR